MNHNVGVGVHNRFDIEIRDCVTNELKCEAVAFNLVLDNMWASLVNNANFFVNISFGSGTGSLNPSRTSLFSQISTRAATLSESVIAYPTSRYKRFITLAPEEFVGQTIREVGIYNPTYGLVTHAMLQDAEGNPISITKTATDVITIYATVFSTFNVMNDLDLIGIGDGSNDLIKYLAGITTSFNNITISAGSSKTPSSVLVGGLMSSALGSVSGTFSSKDIPNKKATTPVLRMGTAVGNGHITEIAYGTVARMVLPKPDICPKVAYTDVPVGTGDGVKTKFILPSKNIDDTTIVLKKNGVTLTKDVDYTMKKINAVNFMNIDTENNGYSGFSSYPCNGQKMPNQEKFIGIGTYNLLYGPMLGGSLFQKGKIYDTNFGTGGSNENKFKPSPIDDLIIFGYPSAPFYRCFDYSGNIPLLVTDLSFDVPPTKDMGNVAWSPDGQYLITQPPNSTIKIYKREGKNFTKLPDIGATLQTYTTMYGNINCIGDYVFDTCAGNNNITLEVLKRNGANYELCTLVGYVHNNYPTSVVMNDAANTVLIPSGNTLRRMSVAGTTLTLMADVSLGAGIGTIDLIARIPNSNNVLIFHNSAPYLTIYDWTSEGVFTEVSKAPTGLIVSGPYSQTSLAGDKTLIVGGNSITNSYDLSAITTEITLITPPINGAALTATYSVNGIHKTDQYVIDFQISVQYGEGV